MAYVSAGKYIIHSAINEDLVLIPSGGSKSKGARITTATLTETDNRCYWHAAVGSNSYNRFWNYKAGTNTGNMMATKIQNNNAVTQSAYNINTGAWILVSSGHTMVFNGTDVGTYYIRPRANGSLYLTVPQNGGNLYLTSIIPSTSSTVTITATSETLTNIQVNRTTFETAVDNIAGTYSFNYDGTNWLLNEETATLNTYGITYSGTPATGDTIAIVFTSSAPADTSRQEFYFESSTYLNSKLATPKNLRTPNNTTYVIANGATSFKPQWQSSSSAKVYEMRYRSRRYDMDGNLITEGQLADGWTKWTGWNMITATPQLNNKKKYNGTMASNTAVPTPGVDNVSYSKAEIQVVTRLTDAKNSGAYNKNLVGHGYTVNQIINQWCNPSLTFTAAIYSPDGLALTYSTNYTIAGSSITINYIKDNGITLIQNYKFTGQDYTGDLYLNCDELYSLPNANDTIIVNATITEENGVAKTTVTNTLTVVFDQSWGLTLAPTYEITERLTVLAGIRSYATLQLYMERKQLDGTSLWVGCDKVFDDNENVVFELAPPYGEAPNLMWVAIDENSNWTSSITAPTGITVASKFYSWFWVDEEFVPHTVILKYRVGSVMQPKDEITMGANKFITTGREYPVFRYSKSVERELDIEGAILNGESDNYCKKSDFEAMLAANHCVYRQPDGKWYQVAIKKMSFSREDGYTKVTISQEAETR